MAGRSSVVASQEQREALPELAASRDRAEADRTRAILLTLVGWTTNCPRAPAGEGASGAGCRRPTSLGSRRRSAGFRWCCGKKWGPSYRRPRHTLNGREHAHAVEANRLAARFAQSAGRSRRPRPASRRRKRGVNAPLLFIMIYGPVPGVARKPAVIVLDNGPIHVSKATRKALEARAPWLTVEWLPKYAPELNDIERSWPDLKSHHLARRTFADEAELEKAIHRAVASMNNERGTLRWRTFESLLRNDHPRFRRSFPGTYVRGSNL